MPQRRVRVGLSRKNTQAQRRGKSDAGFRMAALFVSQRRSGKTCGHRKGGGRASLNFRPRLAPLADLQE